MRKHFPIQLSQPKENLLGDEDRNSRRQKVENLTTQCCLERTSSMKLISPGLQQIKCFPVFRLLPRRRRLIQFFLHKQFPPSRRVGERLLFPELFTSSLVSEKDENIRSKTEISFECIIKFRKTPTGASHKQPNPGICF